MKVFLFFFISILLLYKVEAQEKRFFTDEGVETDSTNSYYYVLSMINDVSDVHTISFYTKSNTVFYNEGLKDDNGVRPRTYYYPDGVKKASANFQTDKPTGIVKAYYSNGAQQSELIFEPYNLWQQDEPVIGIIDYWDSAGNQIVKAGNGYCHCNLSPFLNSVIVQSGSVVNGVKAGEWKGNSENGNLKFTESYNNGLLVKGVQYYKGEMFEYKKTEQRASPVGGAKAFYDHVSKVISYPLKERRKETQGTVFVEFIVSESGDVNNARVLKGISKECDEEAIKAVSTSPKWRPGLLRGRPEKEQWMLPIIFKLR